MRFKFLLLAFCAFASSAFGQKKIDKQHFVDLLQSGAYGRVFNECMDMRNGVYGKCAILDYFIAKSLCLDGYQQKSNEWLAYMLANYPLRDATRSFITNDINHCRNNNGTSSLTNILTVPLPQASVSGMTKLGPIINCTDKSQLIQWDSLFTENELEKRLFPINQKAECAKKIQSIVGNEYKVSIADRFVIVSKTSQGVTNEEVEKVKSALEKAFQFYKKYYNLSAPDKLITVYLMPDQNSLHQVAYKVHGIDVGNATLGYSLLSDLSLLGISDPDHVGTLYHELFHLVIRTDAGDIPAWLDEGLASLYSVFRWSGDTLMGSPTWRIAQLRPDYLYTADIAMPMLKQLVNFNWEEFNGGEEINLCNASVNYAFSNHFMLFLQEKGLLQPLVTAFKSRKSPGKNTDSAAKNNVDILEQVYGLPVNLIQADFQDWFKKKYHFDLYKDDQYKVSQADYFYMMLDAVAPKINNNIGYIASHQTNVNFQDSITLFKKDLQSIHERFQQSSSFRPTNYANKDEQAQYDDMMKQLKSDLMSLLNRTEAVVKKLR